VKLKCVRMQWSFVCMRGVVRHSRRQEQAVSVVVVGVRHRRPRCNTVSVKAFISFVSSTVRRVVATAAVDLGEPKLCMMFSSVVQTTNSSASASCRFVAASAEQLAIVHTQSSTMKITNRLKINARR